MKITRYGFIVKGAGYDSERHRATLESSAFSTTVICVNSVAEGLQAAKELQDEGVQVIELCGGFESDSAEKIMEELGNRTPVGVVRFEDKAKELLEN